ncbi:STAS domain-containing protein [Halobacillus sp. Marseille-Q1614]|uniref:STAS domain-containing protein n=1 Tax=Halobacillus sp. Marseille-Q1614 TaxID=2709134 RepID=UPI00156EDB5C|nr:STAS domain-containing protein [Halobacillus sp. Marseille-Q1614]
MKQADRSFPLPFYVINKNFYVQSYSKQAKDLWGEPDSLLEIIDEESKNKIKKWVAPELHQTALEVHLKPFNAEPDPITADMYVTWNNDLYAQVIFLIKDEKLRKVTKTLNNLRSRLNDTNFELLEEKEKLEEVIDQNNRLSAPFIELTQDTALIPLFGDLSEEKMRAVENNLLVSSQKEDMDRLLFDFTAVGEMDREGVHVLTNMMTSLFYMGLDIIIIGVKPVQAKHLHEMEIPSQVNFMNSLQQAIDKYC